MDKIITFHKENFKQEPEVMAKVPGVITLMGVFADFCKGYSITCTGTLSLRIAISKRDDNTVKLFDATRMDKRHFSTASSLKLKKEDRWANYAKGVFYELMLEGYSVPEGLNITVKGPLLFCDSLTISASMSIGLILCLDKMCGYDLEKNTIIRIAYQAISRFCKLNCRYRDLITLLYAKKDNILFFDLQSMKFTVEKYPFIGQEVYGIIIDPQVPPQYLREEIEEKRVEAHFCCSKLETYIKDNIKIRDYSIRELKGSSFDTLNENEKRTCEYVISETRNSYKGFEALSKNDYSNFAKKLSNIYLEMRDVFEISCPEVDWIVKRAHESEGIFGASLINNGATGSIYVILNEKGEQRLKQHLEDYERIFDFVPEIRFFSPSGPAKVLTD